MSRVLPPAPNLDHLRKQAKALLRDLRKDRPDARLTDAQQQIAAEYGFANWTKLKAHLAAAQESSGPSATTRRARPGLRIHVAADDSAGGSLKQAILQHGVGTPFAIRELLAMYG